MYKAVAASSTTPRKQHLRLRRTLLAREKAMTSCALTVTDAAAAADAAADADARK